MKEKFKLPEQAIRLWFWLFAALCLIAAVLMPDHGQMVEGMLRLCTLPYQSANSYFDASGGGFAGDVEKGPGQMSGSLLLCCPHYTIKGIFPSMRQAT